MTIDIEIIYAGLAIVVTAIALYGAWLARQWLTNKLGVETMREVEQYAIKLVEAAEQMSKSGQLQADLRYRWVVERLQARFKDLDEDDIKAFIESSVFWLKEANTLLNRIEIDKK
jgi:hypothetical protein